MKHAATVLFVLVAGSLGGAPRADEITLESVPPVVVRTTPAAGTVDVDPQLTEIQVTFSKDMLDGNWSWVMLSAESFPKMEGAPRYLADRRTCVLRVTLEPAKTYALWLNTDKFRNFKDTARRAAVPYLLVFKTR